MWTTLWGAPAGRRTPIAALLTATLIVVAFAFGGDRLRFYGSGPALVAAQKEQGYLWVGTLGRPRWPALVVDRDSGERGVDFVTAAGQQHRYEGFTGAMKALHLRAVAGRSDGFTMVFHRPLSADDTAPVSPR